MAESRVQELSLAHDEAVERREEQRDLLSGANQRIEQLLEMLETARGDAKRHKARIAEEDGYIRGVRRELGEAGRELVRRQRAEARTFAHGARELEKAIEASLKPELEEEE